MRLTDKKKIEPEFNRASKLWQDKKTDEAVKIFRKLDREFPNHPGILGMLGAIYFRLNKAVALGYFEKVVKLAPKSELASRGLFHCLWTYRRYDEALSEMRRYLKRNGYSKEYALTMEELDESGLFQAEFMPPYVGSSKKSNDS